jgi:hypothetical protein
VDRRVPPAAPATEPDAACLEADCRCACGSLLARLVGGCVELKCRRCKRVLRLPLEDADDSRAWPAAVRAADAR